MPALGEAAVGLCKALSVFVTFLLAFVLLYLFVYFGLHFVAFKIFLIPKQTYLAIPFLTKSLTSLCVWLV